MAFQVQLTEDAARDLAEIFDYLDRSRGDFSASPSLHTAALTRRSCWTSASRSTAKYSANPCRIIYRVLGRNVYVS